MKIIDRPILYNPETRTSLEDKENFLGQKVLVVGGSDAHGVSMAVLTAEYLEEKGAVTSIYIGSPVVKRGGEDYYGPTHAGGFWKSTIDNLPIDNVDRVVICDIPLDKRDLHGSEDKLVQLSDRVGRDQLKRGKKLEKNRVFLTDHHTTNEFQLAWTPKLRTDPSPLYVETQGVFIKNADTAEASRLGEKPDLVARIGAIADRDPSVLPITEDEMLLAKGLDAAIRPGRPKPREAEEIAAWEQETQERLNIAVEKLKAREWDYFRQEAQRIETPEVPVASGFGKVAIVDTQNLTQSFMVLKTLEATIEHMGVNQTPYAMATVRELDDSDKMDRVPADVITIIRHWTREDLPSVENVLKQKLGEDRYRKLVDDKAIYGPDNAKTMRLPVNDRVTAELMADFVEAVSGEELPDFSKIRSIVMCGDPNSGKSVLSTILRESLLNLGVRVQHLDLDKAAPTPQSYLDAENAAAKAQLAFDRGEIDQAELIKARKVLEDEKNRRKASKRPWTDDLANEARQELLDAAKNPDYDFIIGDIGGGLITRDNETNKIVHIQRLTSVNAIILGGSDGVIIVSNNEPGAKEWKQLVEVGVDSETGIRIEGKQPKVIGIYQSVLEGKKQNVSGQSETMGIVTNLDRTLADKIYNPSVFVTALMISRGVQKRKGG